MAEEVKKFKPAGIKDNVKAAYADIAVNEQKTELRTGEGHEFDNKVLLEMLGFKEKYGVMTLSASSNTVERDKEGNVVTRKSNDGRVLTDKKARETDR